MLRLQPTGGSLFFTNCMLIPSLFASIQARCSSVTKTLPISDYSFSLLKLSITTPTNRLRMNWEPTIM